MESVAFDLLVDDSAGSGRKVFSSGVTAMFVCVRFVLERYFTYQAC